MTEVLLFHHAQGVTTGISAFADELRAAGHTVHVPDLFDGRIFSSIEEGMAFINRQWLRCAPGARPAHGGRTAGGARLCRLLVR